MASPDSSITVDKERVPKAVEIILTRASAIRLSEPAPSREHLDLMIRAAANAPDHGRLRPWRFIVIKPEDRARFGEILADILIQADSGAAPELLQRERDKAMRAPMILVAVAKVNPAAKIPAMEQVLAVAASVENLILAAHALGYGTMWKTGAPAYDESLKRALSLEKTDQIVGFLYLGTTVGRTMARDIRTDGILSFF